MMPVAMYCQEAVKAKKSVKSPPNQSSPAVPESRPDGAERVKEIPKDAVEVRADLFRWVDENGKAWIYRRTVFGFLRSAETENMRQLLANPPDKQNVRELPDGTLEFTKMTPFGVGRFTRKKDELSEEEKKLWDKAKSEKAVQSQPPQTKEQKK